MGPIMSGEHFCVVVVQFSIIILPIGFVCSATELSRTANMLLSGVSDPDVIDDSYLAFTMKTDSHSLHWII